MTSGLEMKYFVLKPDGNSEFHRASRFAMIAYAAHIKGVNPTLALELEAWAEQAESNTHAKVRET